MNIEYKILGNHGRLGNCLFQIATTINLSIEYNAQYQFPDHIIIHDYFPLIGINNSKESVQCVQYNEPHFHYKKIELDVSNNYNLTGYYQSEKYFKDNWNKIKPYFTFNLQLVDDTYLKDYKYKELVSIHFRFGDYLQKKDFHTCLTDTDYYVNAINQFNKNDVVFVVFSDDIELAKQYMSKLNVMAIFIEYSSEINDLYLMSKCNHNIIANSSFSWWGSYLNENVHKKTIAPKQWFSNKSLNWKDIYTNEMIII